MTVVIFLLLIVLFIVVITTSSRDREVLHKLSDHVFELGKEVRQLKQELKPPAIGDAERWSPKPAAPPAQPSFPAQQQPVPLPTPELPKQEQAIPTPVPVPEPKPIIPPVPQEEKSVVTELLNELAMEEGSTPKAPLPDPAPRPAQPAQYYQPTEGWWDRWMRNNPDMEKFIGENLINKIGIAILVLGIAFFVKYAIDKEWINEVGRVCIGLGCGAALAGVAHYMRKSYRAFSSVLAGGGIAVFYFTIALAFHQYHLISQTAAFVIMLVVTAFAVILSLAYDKLELAVIATVGGFLTPFMVSTGSGNYVVLFTYLVILNAGLMVLAFRKRWLLINIISLFFTILIYGGWLTKSMMELTPDFNYLGALLFASLFYVQFLAMNMINQVRFKQPFKAFDFSVLLLINALYFSAGMLLLHNWHSGDYQGLFTVAMGIINFVLAFWFYKREGTDKRLLFLLIGMTLTFLSLAIPVQLHGHTITLFWGAEFVLLYWLYQRSGIGMFRYSSSIIGILALISLGMDWNNAATASHSVLTVIYNDVTGFVTNLVLVIALGVYYWLIRKEDRKDNYLPGMSNEDAGRVALGAGILLLYLTAVFGVNLLCSRFTSYDVPNVYHRLIALVFTLAGMLWMSKKETKRAAWAQPLLFLACFVFYLVSAQFIANMREQTVAGIHPYTHLMIHWLDGALFLYLGYRMAQLIHKRQDVFANAQKSFTWIISLVMVTFFSIELFHAYLVMMHKQGNMAMLVKQYNKAGLSIIWAFCSFALMWLGMKYKYKPLRIVSLSLFAITLVKLFLFDIRGISEGGKIAAFILLGVLLLVVSFMYQKLKKIIIDDKE